MPKGTHIVILWCFNFRSVFGHISTRPASLLVMPPGVRSLEASSEFIETGIPESAHYLWTTLYKEKGIALVSYYIKVIFLSYLVPVFLSLVSSKEWSRGVTDSLSWQLVAVSSQSVASFPRGTNATKKKTFPFPLLWVEIFKPSVNGWRMRLR